MTCTNIKEGKSGIKYGTVGKEERKQKACNKARNNARKQKRRMK